jgi:hypothetical protein
MAERYAADMTDTSPLWRSRIVGHGTADPNELMTNPANWRVHPKRQQQALESLLDQVGWVRNVIVNQATGHLVDGHLRVRLAQTRSEASVPVVYVDLAEDEERLVLASLDPIAALAATDSAALMALMGSIEVSSPDQTEVTTLVKDLAGTSAPSTSPSPTQDQIDARSDELDHAFEDRHLRSYDATCPACGSEFAFAR